MKSNKLYLGNADSSLTLFLPNECHTIGPQALWQLFSLLCNNAPNGRPNRPSPLVSHPVGLCTHHFDSPNTLTFSGD